MQYNHFYGDDTPDCDFEDAGEGVRAFFDAFGLNSFLYARRNVSISLSYSISCVGYYHDNQGHEHKATDKCDHITLSAVPLFLRRGFTTDACYRSAEAITEDCPENCLDPANETITPFSTSEYQSIYVANQTAAVIKQTMLRYGHAIISFRIDASNFLTWANAYNPVTSVYVEKAAVQNPLPLFGTVLGWGVRSPQQGTPGDEFWIVKLEKSLTYFFPNVKPTAHVIRVAVQDVMETNSSMSAFLIPKLIPAPPAGAVSVKACFSLVLSCLLLLFALP
jgi:hypothetical protein